MKKNEFKVIGTKPKSFNILLYSYLGKVRNYLKYCILKVIKPPWEHFTLVLVDKYTRKKKSGDVRSPHKIPVFLLMVLICHIFVLIVYLNLHYGLVWASGLSREGFECSKDPFAIKIQYKYHSVRVILYMGIQQGCSAKALLIFLLFFWLLRSFIIGSVVTFTIF